MAAFPAGTVFRGRRRVHPFGEMSQVSVFSDLLTHVNVVFLGRCGAEASLWL